MADAGSIILNGRYTHVSELYTDVTELSPRKAVDLLDASISFEDITRLIQG